MTRDLHLHFESRANKPPVFRFTEPPIAAAKARSGLAKKRVSLGEDLRSLSWLGDANGLVTSNDIVRDPRFPIAELATKAPQLLEKTFLVEMPWRLQRSIHISRQE